MPTFAVEVQGYLQGISSVSIPSDEADQYPWHICLLCGSCGERTDKPVVVSREDEVEGIRGASVNLKITCKFCKRQSDVKILDGESVYTAEDAPAWKTFLKIETRGMEPTEVTLADDFSLSIKGEGGFEAEDAHIEDGEFYGYDEDNQVQMEVTEWKMRVVKSGK